MSFLFRAVVVLRSEGRTTHTLCGWVRCGLVMLVGCARYTCRLNASVESQKVRLQDVRFTWGYNAWCEMGGGKFFLLYVCCREVNLRRSIIVT